MKRIFIVALLLLSAGGAFVITGVAGGQAAIDAKLQASAEAPVPRRDGVFAQGRRPAALQGVRHDPTVRAGNRRSSAWRSGRRSWIRSSGLRRPDQDPRRHGHQGVLLTGIIVTEHHEPYGDFSDRPPGIRRAVQGQEHPRSVQGRQRHRRGLAGDDQRDERVAGGPEQRAARRAATARAARARQVTQGDSGDDSRSAAILLLVARPLVSRGPQRRARPGAIGPARGAACPAHSPTAGSSKTTKSRRPAGGEICARRPGTSASFAAFTALALVSFFRKSVRLKYVTFWPSVLYLGFVKSQLISIVNVFALLEWNLPIFRYSLAWYLLARCSRSSRPCCGGGCTAAACARSAR